MPLHDADGHIRTTEVDGTEYVGLYAPDQSINVVVDDTEHFGSTHPSGALRVSSQTGENYYDPTGAVYLNRLTGNDNPTFDLQLATNHLQLNTTTFLASGTNHVRCETRTRHKTGNTDFSELRLVYAGWYIAKDGGAGVQTNVPNSVTLQAAIEWPDADTVTVQVTWDGENVGTLASGETAYISDPIYPSQFGLSTFPANTTFWVRRLSELTQNQRYGRHEASTSGIGERSAFSDGLSASQLLGSGALSVPSGGADATAIMGPNAIIGRPTSTPDIAVALIGDSITTGSNDSAVGGDGEAGGGYLARALWDIDGRQVAWIKISAGGAQMSNIAAGTKWIEYLPYCTHAIVTGGTNDMAVGSDSGAATFESLQSIYAICKSNGIRHVEQALILPRTSSTDSWATVANQTAVTEFGVDGARRDALNDLIIAGDSNLDDYFDPNAYAADDTSTDKWIASATTDGVHPNSATHQGIATDFAARAATWS